MPVAPDGIPTLLRERAATIAEDVAVPDIATLQMSRSRRPEPRRAGGRPVAALAAVLTTVSVVAGTVIAIDRVSTDRTQDVLASPSAAPPGSCAGASRPGGEASDSLATATRPFFTDAKWQTLIKEELPPCGDSEHPDESRVAVQATVGWRAAGDGAGVVSIRATSYDPAPSREELVSGQKANASAQLLGERRLSDGSDGEVLLFEADNNHTAIAFSSDGRLVEVSDAREFGVFAFDNDQLFNLAEAAHRVAPGR